MGKHFLALIIIIHLCSAFSLFAEDRIQFMPPPTRYIPPNMGHDTLERDLRRKRQYRRQQDHKNPVGPYSQKRNSYEPKMPQKELKAPKVNYNTMLQLSLILPTINTSGPRSEYTTELSSHLSFLKKIEFTRKKSTSSMWWGLRFAPFSGTGIYENVAGRYSFFYFGPILGIGEVNARKANTNSRERKAAGVIRAETSETLSRTAWFFTGGLAAVSGQAKVEATNQRVDQDMTTNRGAKLDGASFWFEYTYSNIRHDALGINYVSGIQLGRGKTFIWLGIGLAGWA